MTQEEKQLLLKDLCARLPYRINVLTEDNDKGHIIGVDDTENGVFVVHIIEDGDSYTRDESIENFKPYLRPMSSMTEEECGLYDEAIRKDNETLMQDNDAPRVNLIPTNALNFILSRHFDYRGLIEKGLALEAKEEMYKIR